MHFSQFGTLVYLLAPVSGIAVRPHGGVPHRGVPHIPRAVSSASPSSTSAPASRIVNFAAAVPTALSNLNDSDLNITSLWTTAQCNQNSIDDATVAFIDRWYASGVPGAWDAVLGEWGNGAKNGLYRNLEFPAFVSWYFHGPEQWNCKDVGSVPCSSVVRCDEVNHPAGVFAPQSDDTKIILAIFDALTVMMGFTVSAFFSIAQGATTARVSIPRNRESGTQGPVEAPEIQEYQLKTVERTKEALNGSPQEFNGHAYANDMTYQLYTITAAFTRNNAPTVHNKLDAQNSLSSALGDIFKSWKDIESSYLKNIFSGTESSLRDLTFLIDEGKMNFMPNKLDTSKMAAELQAVFYGQLLPTAWKTASDNRGAFPRIVRTDLPCDIKSAYIPEISDYDTMTDVNSVSTRACWREKMVFLVNINEYEGGKPVPWTPLPSTSRSTLSGDKWGGITFDDIVASAMTGYEMAGSKNGYKSPTAEDIEKDTNADQYGKRIRYPGFFNIPVCEGLDKTKKSLLMQHTSNSPFWPCDAPEGFNSKGTTIHVNKGWITANAKTPVCDTFKVDDPGYGDTLSATLYGRFKAENTADSTVKATCNITFSWPKSWADIYYGEDNCMYNGNSEAIKDANGNPVCCNEDSNLTDQVTNPYMTGGSCDPL
ncbi:hypothetical protein N7472_001869 [Penicillium cf. griseofulvum]|uniref:Uncharacterized protein n=1 Tax=Penicillium cf. griseofulvum TaxID=2972120 RepID=A0A9W9MQ24_9EURO|nr:hypothetical protein N7472_001869 [Penicillium cf. griseofulvum]